VVACLVVLAKEFFLQLVMLGLSAARFIQQLSAATRFRAFKATLIVVVGIF